MARVKVWLRVGVSLVLIVWLAGKLDWRGLGRQLLDLEAVWLLPVVLLSPSCILLLAARWRLFLQAQGHRIAFGEMLRVVWAGQFFNSFLPGSTGGDVYKMVAVGQLVPQAQAAAAATVMLDRLSATVVLAGLALLAVIVEPAPLQQALAAGAKIPGAWLILGGAALGLAGVAGALALRYAPAASRTGRVRRFLAQMWITISKGVRDVRVFLGASGLSAVIHLGSFLSVFCLARALRIEVTYPQVLLIMPVVLFAVMLPVTVNGHGLREVLLIGYFEWMGLQGPHGVAPREAAVALSLLFVSNDLLWCLPGGAWFAWRRKAASLRLPTPKTLRT